VRTKNYTPIHISVPLIALLIGLLVLSAKSLPAQKIDSLITIAKSSSGATKFDALFNLAYEYSDVNDSLSLVYANQAYSLAFQLSDSVRIVKSGRIKAGELRRTENIDESIQVAQYVFGIAKRLKNKQEIKMLSHSLAMSYTLKSEYDKALKYNFESLEIRELEGNKKDISTTLNNIGLIYYKLRNWEKSIEFYKKSLTIKREANDRHDLDRLLINIGLCFNALHDYKEAIKYINEGLEECKNNCSEQTVISGQYGLGLSYYETKEYVESKKHFQKSYEVAKRIGDSRFQAENLVYFARLNLIDKKYPETIGNLKEAESISIQKGYGQLLVDTYGIYSKLYGDIDDYKNASSYQSKYIFLKDSLFNGTLVSNLAKAQTNYEERENIKTIAEKSQVVALQKEVIVRQERQYIFIVTITCLVLILAVTLLYFTRRQQKINNELSSAKKKIEEHNKKLEHTVDERTKDLNQSNLTLQRVNEELDYFIYKSSHDLRGPLVTLKGLCNIAFTDLNEPLAIDYFKKFDVTIDKLSVILMRLQMVRNVTNSQLSPVNIDFKKIIDEIILFEKKKGTPENFLFSYEIQPECTIVSDEGLVKIIFENLIDNAVKYRTTHDRSISFAKLALTREKDWIKAIVEDNGIGIHPNEINNIFKMFVRGSEQSEIGGVGLYLVKAAVDKIGGEITVAQSNSSGTIFQVLFPIDFNKATLI